MGQPGQQDQRGRKGQHRAQPVPRGHRASQEPPGRQGEPDLQAQRVLKARPAWQGQPDLREPPGRRVLQVQQAQHRRSLGRPGQLARRARQVQHQRHRGRPAQQAPLDQQAPKVRKAFTAGGRSPVAALPSVGRRSMSLAPLATSSRHRVRFMRTVSTDRAVSATPFQKLAATGILEAHRSIRCS